MKTKLDSETYKQMVTNHAVQLEVMEEYRKELKAELKEIGLHIRQTRLYLKRTKERYEMGN